MTSQLTNSIKIDDDEELQITSIFILYIIIQLTKKIILQYLDIPKFSKFSVIYKKFALFQSEILIFVLIKFNTYPP